MSKRTGIYIHIDSETDMRLGVYARALPSQRLPDGSTKKWSKGSLAALAIRKYLDALRSFIAECPTLDDVIDGLREIDPNEVEIQSGRDLPVSDTRLKEF